MISYTHTNHPSLITHDRQTPPTSFLILKHTRPSHFLRYIPTPSYTHTYSHTTKYKFTSPYISPQNTLARHYLCFNAPAVSSTVVAVLNFSPRQHCHHEPVYHVVMGQLPLISTPELSQSIPTATMKSPLNFSPSISISSSSCKISPCPSRPWRPRP